jgi:hypothetical protein
MRKKFSEWLSTRDFHINEIDLASLFLGGAAIWGAKKAKNLYDKKKAAAAATAAATTPDPKETIRRTESELNPQERSEYNRAVTSVKRSLDWSPAKTTEDRKALMSLKNVVFRMMFGGLVSWSDAVRTARRINKDREFGEMIDPKDVYEAYTQWRSSTGGPYYHPKTELSPEFAHNSPAYQNWVVQKRFMAQSKHPYYGAPTYVPQPPKKTRKRSPKSKLVPIDQPPDIAGDVPGVGQVIIDPTKG